VVLTNLCLTFSRAMRICRNTLPEIGGETDENDVLSAVMKVSTAATCHRQHEILTSIPLS
jgi:hypothetical protein